MLCIPFNLEYNWKQQRKHHTIVIHLLKHDLSKNAIINYTFLDRTDRNFITLKLLQFLVTLHTYIQLFTILVTKQGIITMDELCVKIYKYIHKITITHGEINIIYTVKTMCYDG